MGYLGEEIKKLGFGLMRLPQKDGIIDVDQVKEMVDLFLDNGFTYFVTFIFCIIWGNTEPIILMISICGIGCRRKRRQA